MSESKLLPPIRNITAEIQVYSDEPADSTSELLREQFAAMVALHDEWFRQLLRLKMLVESHKVALPEVCDCAFIIRETKEQAESIVKECNTMLDKLAFAANVIYLTDPNPPKSIEAVYCTGYVDTKLVCSPPTFAKDPVRYNELMDFLGVPENLRDIGKINCVEGEFVTEIVKLNWTGLQDYIHALTLKGYGLPPGIDEKDTYPKPTLICRRKRYLLPPVKNGAQ